MPRSSSAFRSSLPARFRIVNASGRRSRCRDRSRSCRRCFALGARRRAGGRAGEADAHGLHLQRFPERIRAGRHDQGALRGGLRLHARMGDERRRRHAARAAEARRRVDQGRRGARARHQPDRGRGGDRALRAAWRRCVGARPAGRMDRRNLHALRLGLVRLRLRRDAGSRTRRRAWPSSSTPRTGRRSSSRIRAPRRRASACWSGCASIYGDEAGDAWRKLAPKIVTVTQGWSEAYGLFLKGEADMVLSYTTSPAYHIAVEKDPNYKAAIFPEGHYLEIEVAGMTKATDDAGARARRSWSSCSPSRSSRRSRRETGCIRRRRRRAAFRLRSKGSASRKSRSTPTPAEVEKNRRAWIDEWLAAMSK